MKISTLKGFSFGLTSGIITTLGLLVGINASTHSKLAIIGGVLSIAVADAFSDALGIHISTESENKYSAKHIWKATLATFITKFVFALSFIVPILLFSNSTAIIISIFWGFGLLAIYSYYLAEKQKISPFKTIGEHLLIAVLVIIITQIVGQWIGQVLI